MEILAKRITRERENRKKKNVKWTQEYVAHCIGVSRPTYTAYEKGTKTPPTKRLEKLAELFHVTSDYLVGKTDDPNFSFAAPEEDVETLLNDPELEYYFKRIQSSPQTIRNEAKAILQYLLQKEKGRQPGDPQDKN